MCVCYLEEASQLKIWVGEQSQVGEVFGIFLARFNFLIFSKFKKILLLLCLSLKMLLLFQRQPFLSHSSFCAFLGNWLLHSGIRPTRQEVRHQVNACYCFSQGRRVCITEWKWRHRTRLPYLLLPQNHFGKPRNASKWASMSR